MLSGIRVVELGNFITGPLAAMMLADLGADVIKVERPEGDPFRRAFGQDYGPAFTAYNRNKKSVVLDTAKPDDREALARLVASAGESVPSSDRPCSGCSSSPTRSSSAYVASTGSPCGPVTMWRTSPASVARATRSTVPGPPSAIGSSTTFNNTGDVTLGNDATDVTYFNGSLSTAGRNQANSTFTGGFIRTPGAGITLDRVSALANTTIDTTNNGTCDSGTWTSTATITTRTASPAGLVTKTTYYWQVRAKNAAGATEGNSGTWWSFTTA